jgi:two-component system chemotaxis sensor kinase CheA
MNDLSEYSELYIRTAFELLKQLQDDLPVFIRNQLDSSLIEKLHRNAHSLKSQSLVMGFENTGLLCKELEYIFRKVKDEQIVIDSDLSKDIEDSLQKLYDSLESIKTSGKETDLSIVTSKLQKISGVNTN